MPDLTQLVNPLQKIVPQAVTSAAIPTTVSILNDDSPEYHDAELKKNIYGFLVEERGQNSNNCQPVMEEQPKKKAPDALWTRGEVIQHLQEEGMLFVNDMPAATSQVIAMTLPGMDSYWKFEGNHFMVELKDADPRIVSMNNLRRFVADNHQLLGKEMIGMMAEIPGFEDLLDLTKASKEEQEEQKNGLRFINDLDGSEVESIQFSGMKSNGKLQGNYFKVTRRDGGSESIAIDKLRNYIDENKEGLGPWMLYKICEVIGIEYIRGLCDLSSREEELMAKGAQRPNRVSDGDMGPDNFFIEEEEMSEGEQVKDYSPSAEQLILFHPQGTSDQQAKREPVPVLQYQEPKKLQTFSEHLDIEQSRQSKQSEQSEHMESKQSQQRIGSRTRMRL